MKLLIPGGAGYIGSHTARYAQEHGHEVVVLDDFSTGHEWAIKDCEILRVDLLDQAKLAQLLKGRSFDGAIHFAAKSLVGSKNVSLSFAPTTSNDRLAGFSGDGKTMTSRMLDGTFPPYRHFCGRPQLTGCCCGSCSCHCR